MNLDQALEGVEMEGKGLFEYWWDNSILLPSSVKKMLAKTLKRPHLHAAIRKYIEFREKGVQDGSAAHKAASLYGFNNTHIFWEIIQKYELQGGKYGIATDQEYANESAQEIRDIIHTLVMEEDSPTNTSKGSVPDQDHGTKKKKKKKKGENPFKKNGDKDGDNKDGDNKDGDNKDNDDDGKKKKEKEVKEHSYQALIGRIEKLEEARGLTMPAGIRRKISNGINKIAQQNYHTSIASPIYDADKVLQAFGYRLVDIDGTDYAAIYTGAEGRASINIAEVGGNMVQNVGLSVQWYKMRSGLWEITMYLS